jgi:predicted nucleic acid-binding protein
LIGDINEDLGLRGYDAVHLATVLELGDEEVVLATWDRDLAQAADASAWVLGSRLVKSGAALVP